MHIGLAVFFCVVIIWNKGRIELSCLLPVIGIALAMEALDFFDDYAALGYFRWLASLHDIINTCLWPIIIVVMSVAYKLNKSR